MFKSTGIQKERSDASEQRAEPSAGGRSWSGRKRAVPALLAAGALALAARRFRSRRSSAQTAEAPSGRGEEADEPVSGGRSRLAIAGGAIAALLILRGLRRRRRA